MHPIPVTHTDTSTYKKLWAPAKGLAVSCPDNGAPGWGVAGTYYLIYLFFYVFVGGGLDNCSLFFSFLEGLGEMYVFDECLVILLLTWEVKGKKGTFADVRCFRR